MYDKKMRQEGAINQMVDKEMKRREQVDMEKQKLKIDK